jgi:hypothetical protein
MGVPPAKALERVAGVRSEKRAGAAAVGNLRPGSTAVGWEGECARACKPEAEILRFGSLIAERSAIQISCAFLFRGSYSTTGESIGDSSGSP